MSEYRIDSYRTNYLALRYSVKQRGSLWGWNTIRKGCMSKEEAQEFIYLRENVQNFPDMKPIINIVLSEEDGSFIVEIPELKKFSVFGNNLPDVLEEIAFALGDHIEFLEETGDEVPHYIEGFRHARY